jgi:proteasome lid subunit RPN8/RPN11
MNPLCFRKKQPRTSNTYTPAVSPESLGEAADPAWAQTGTFPRGKTLVGRTHDEALSQASEILRLYDQAMREGSRTTLDLYWESLGFLCDVVKVTNEAEALMLPVPPMPSRKADPAVSEYRVSSLFLAQCHRFLTTNPRGHERLHLVTGQKLSQRERTLDFMSKVALSEQSAVGAVADQLALKSALMEMDEWGHALYGLFHSHPGQGALATRPSSIDLATHERYERCYPLIGCIFVRDGTLRFFRHSPEPFAIIISGTGIVPINEDEHVYQIKNPSIPRHVSYETITGSY